MSNELAKWSSDMRALYDKVKTGEVTLEKAETLANICGKAIKAEALSFAREVFEENSRRRGLPPPQQKNGEVVSTQ